jgi:fumarate reductase iron-sulfur subunit
MSNGKNGAGRRLKFEIFRFNPMDPDSKPYMQSFELDEKPYMSLFMALNEIRESHDASLQFDFACRSAICGSCGMMVNGRPALGCRTLTSDLPAVIHLHPLPVFKLVGDLSVDTGTWFREMVEKTEGWIHAQEAFDPDVQEARMDDDTAAEIYEHDRCIECGCCVASCGAANVNDDFLGPAGLNRVARFAMDPRDERNDAEWFDVVSNQDGIFGCIGMMACHDICPKELPLLEVYAYLRRKALSTAITKRN